jgi:hypothetical protein
MEERDLLVKVLCEMLFYGVKIKTEYFTKATLISIRKNIIYGSNKDLLVTYDISGEENPFQTDERISTFSEVKPYLFPLSSMTEEQKEELRNLGWNFDNFEINNINECLGTYREYVTHLDCFVLIDWLNKNRFDYHRLIEKGLAIDATNLNIY